jgi:prepilin-type processing-associated H-X9-DG protein
MHNHHDARGKLPPGTFRAIQGDNQPPDAALGNNWNRINWFQMVLQYMEQDALYREILPWWDGTRGSFGFSATPRDLISRVTPGFWCPSDPGYDTMPPGFNGGFTGNYLACASSTILGNAWALGGNYRGGIDLNGVLYPTSKTTLEGITDGTSNTLVMSESIRHLDFFIVGQYWFCWDGGVLFTTANPPNTPVPDRGYRCAQSHPEINLPCVVGGGATGQPSPADNMKYSARSLHTGGVNGAMADGSVRFFSNNINAAAWRAMGSRSGGEVIQE